MITTDTMVLFWGEEFSQWHDSEIIIKGVTYSCAEQFMMAMKAAFFCDFETQEKIMKTLEPSRQKSLGRTVKNFNVEEWSKVSRKFVYAANYAKFTQHPDLYKILMATGNKEIVEASPYDRIWGIGLGANDPRAQDKSQWQGLNWLGECIMKVREDLIKEESMK